MKQTFLGIDLGTSGLKAVLVDDERRIIAQACREYEADHPGPGWAQIDPEVWFDQMIACLRELFARQDPKLVRSIGVTGQMHTLVVLDAAGSPVRPAMMWNDTRTESLLPELKRKISAFEEGEHLAGIISTGSPAANLYWMRLEEPELFCRIRHFLIGPDYLVYRLTGEIGTDLCEASTSSLYQIRAGKWSEQMRELIGLPARAYPTIRGSAQTAGRVLPELCRLLGLCPETEVIVGTGDNPASAIATGCLLQGYPVLSLGTSGVLMLPVKNPDELEKGKVILVSTDGEQIRFLVQGVVQSTGESINWWARRILEQEDLDELSRKLERRLADTKGDSFAGELLFYPHISGEKTIYADPKMRGAFLGLSPDTSREEMYYAVIEGLCFAVRELAQRMKLPMQQDALRVVGGGTRSRVWMQVLANVLDIPVRTMKGTAGPAYGIALLAMSRADRGRSLQELTRGLLQVEETFLPDQKETARLQKKYDSYLRIRDAMKYVSEGNCENPALSFTANGALDK